LARETDGGLYDEQFLVAPLVRQAIDLQRHLLNRKLVDVEIDYIENPCVCGHQQAFSIAVNNLVRNAFEHTHTGQGPISILIKERELLITNQLSSEIYKLHTPAGASSQGHGLGLGIVQRLCERNGWSFRLHIEGARVVACLSW
ncbi:MAG TPA: ATP-binding protein, partial [Rheinheimera sp.]|uniref:sensor histidine kinase n=1 Tax=Rheinheimera sp. TaxID=1869214 RepID=UPI002B4635B8